MVDENLLQSLFQNCLLYREFKKVRGTPQYWEEVKKDLFGMLRQLNSPPTFLLSLSMADTRWTELIEAVGHLFDLEVDVLNIDARAKVQLLKKDPCV